MVLRSWHWFLEGLTMELGCPIPPHPLQVVGESWAVVDGLEEGSVRDDTGGLDTVPLPLQVWQMLTEFLQTSQDAPYTRKIAS